MIHTQTTVRAVLCERATPFKLLECVGQTLLGTTSSDKCELGGAGHLCTVLNLNPQLLLELTQGKRSYPEDTADQLEIVRKLVLSSYTGLDVESTLVNTSWQGALGYGELEPIPKPMEGLG